MPYTTMTHPCLNGCAGWFKLPAAERGTVIDAGPAEVTAGNVAAANLEHRTEWSRSMLPSGDDRPRRSPDRLIRLDGGRMTTRLPPLATAGDVQALPRAAVHVPPMTVPPALGRHCRMLAHEGARLNFACDEPDVTQGNGEAGLVLDHEDSRRLASARIASRTTLAQGMPAQKPASTSET